MIHYGDICYDVYVIYACVSICRSEVWSHLNVDHTIDRCQSDAYIYVNHS